VRYTSEYDVVDLNDIRPGLFLDRQPRGNAYTVGWWPVFREDEKMPTKPFALLGTVMETRLPAFRKIDSELFTAIRDAFGEPSDRSVHNGSCWLEGGALYWAENDPDIWAMERVVARLFLHLLEKYTQGKAP